MTRRTTSTCRRTRCSWKSSGSIWGSPGPMSVAIPVSAARVVHVDGRAVKSCTMLAVQADGARVTTIEGIGEPGRPASDAGGLPGTSRAAVRVLHAGHDHDRHRSGRSARNRSTGTRCATGSKATSAAAPVITTSSTRSWTRPRRCASCGIPGAGGVPGAMAEAIATGIGAPVRRKEDERFITGRGRYTDDINQPGQLYAVFLRSPHARARIDAIDAAEARSRRRRDRRTHGARTWPPTVSAICPAAGW
jgi:hypothetical protein